MTMGSSTADTSPRTTRAVGRLLFAVRGAERPTIALEVATRLGRTMGLDLHVLRVLPARVGLSVLETSAVDSFRTLAWALSLRRETLAWVAGVMNNALPEGRVEVRTGRFEQEIARQATKLEPELIVVPGAGLGDGAAVLRVVQSTRTSVFVARSLSSCRNTVVAGTNLESPEYPVVRRASSIAERLGCSLIAVHNVRPREILSASGLLWPVSVPVIVDTSDAAAARLEQLRARLEAGVETILSQETDATEAILRAADLSNAQVIVVGARRHRWLARLLRTGVARQLVERSQRSVLICPVGEGIGPASFAGV